MNDERPQTLTEAGEALHLAWHNVANEVKSKSPFKQMWQAAAWIVSRLAKWIDTLWT